MNSLKLTYAKWKSLTHSGELNTAYQTTHRANRIHVWSGNGQTVLRAIVDADDYSDWNTDFSSEATLVSSESEAMAVLEESAAGGALPASQIHPDPLKDSELIAADITRGLPILGRDASDYARLFRVDTLGRLLVSTETAGFAGFHVAKAVGGPTPARLVSTGAEPFLVGTEALNIDIHGVSETCTFPASSATAGTSTSDHDPATSNGSKSKMKISCDGGNTKQITIAKNLVGGQVIAAAIQAEIRSEVPNGTNVVCDYDDSISGKYRITSGTTGASSSVVVVDSGKSDLSEILKIGVVNGGLEIQGLPANNYSIYEVVDELNDQLSGIDSYVFEGDVVVETIGTGTLATLEVTGGAANTDLGFSTSEVTGENASEATNMAVDGSSSVVVFAIPLHASKVFLVKRLIYVIRDGGMELSKFGGIDELANGVVVEVESNSEPIQEWFTFKTNSELLARARDGGQLIVDAYSTEDLVHADFLLDPGIPLRPGSTDKIRFIIQDDLSALTNFDVLAEGYLV